MKALFFSPAALGDMIICSGIARELLTHYDEIHIPLNKEFIKTACGIFMDESRIKVFPYNSDLDLNQYAQEKFLVRIPSPYGKIYTETTNSVERGIIWDEQLYTLFDIPYSKRYSTFKCNLTQNSLELKNKITTNKRIILVHQNYFSYNGDLPIDILYWRDSAKLDPLEHFQIIKIDPSLSDNMMDYIELIKMAEEIHCVPSSFFCLVDSVHKITNAKLYYHNIRKTTSIRVNNQWNENRWIFVNYSEKF